MQAGQQTTRWNVLEIRVAAARGGMKRSGIGAVLRERFNVWIIGREGRFCFVTLSPAWFAFVSCPHASRSIVLSFLVAGVLGGMLWGGFVALLRSRFTSD